MFARGLRSGLAMIALVAAGDAVAVTPHPALPAKPFAGFAAVPGQSGLAETRSDKTIDVVKITTKSQIANAGGSPSLTASRVVAPTNWRFMILGFAAIGFASRVDVRKFARITF